MATSGAGHLERSSAAWLALMKILYHGIFDCTGKRHFLLNANAAAAKVNFSPDEVELT